MLPSTSVPAKVILVPPGASSSTVEVNAVAIGASFTAVTLMVAV